MANPTEFLTKPAISFTVSPTMEKPLGDSRTAQQAIEDVRGHLRILGENYRKITLQDLIDNNSNRQN